ncbi:MAG: DUF2961 domain-containing protein [Planctomycetes bacterium]|nr:DUF2961 domain-containing protein [Planctomycetota bacterium]
MRRRATAIGTAVIMVPGTILGLIALAAGGCGGEAGPGRSEGPSLFGPLAAKPADATITLDTLLDELVDLRRLTKLPQPAYTTKQFSSYDRKSKSPSEEWFANGDANQYLREEQNDGRREWVMADVDGPGAIVRIWSANPKGNIRIYLDGNPAPAIEAPMGGLLGGTVEGFPKPLAGERSRGWNLYFPIPYAKHCKVTSDERGFYYHVNYRTYAAGTKVTTFTMADALRLRQKVFTMASKLLAPREDVPPPADRVRKPFSAMLTPDKEETIYEASGAKAICGFLTHITAEDIEAAARGVVLYMTFDGEKTVECPIGDFYGTAPGLTPYASLPLGISEGDPPDLWCHWWMPFAKSAVIRVRNLSDQDVQLSGGVSTVPYNWDDRSLHFHAGWRQEKQVPTRPFTDWAHLECSGRGRFVGGALHIQNPVRGWWGEGDEKIYVDGETFPSHFGTGTEDYYGYAWCCPERFVHAYHSQPRCDGPNNYGNTSVNRLHIIDDIPFTTQFKFDIENWHSNDRSYTNRAAVNYWYARPGGKDFFQPITEAHVKLEVIPAIKVFKAAGAQEGERLKVLNKTAGRTERQEMTGFDGQWSDGRHLWWIEAKPDDKLTLGFDGGTGGKKNVVVALTKAPDYGIVQLYINDQKVGEPVDLYAGGVTPTGPIDLGEVELTQGENKLTAEIVGANDAAAKAYMFGLDYILLK